MTRPYRDRTNIHTGKIKMRTGIPKCLDDEIDRDRYRKCIRVFFIYIYTHRERISHLKLFSVTYTSCPKSFVSRNQFLIHISLTSHVRGEAQNTLENRITDHDFILGERASRRWTRIEHACRLCRARPRESAFYFKPRELLPPINLPLHFNLIWLCWRD